MDFAVQVDHKMKIKENEKRDKHLDFARELKQKQRKTKKKKQRNIKVTGISIV